MKSRECTYLGYTIGPNGQPRIAPKSKEKMRARLKELTARNRGRSLDKMVEELNRATRGWIEYFKLAAAKKWRSDTDAWLRRRVRCYRLKQCKRRIGISRFLMSEGLPERWTWGGAKCSHGWYRMSNTPQATKAMGLEWFREIGYIPLTA